MKLKFKFLLLIIACVASIYGQQVSLIGSHLAPTESNYKTFLLTNGLNAGSTVDVKLSSSNKNFRSFLQNSFDEVVFGRPRGVNNELTISSKVRGSCRQQSAKIINSDRPIIFLQFAKPFYKIGEEFKFRVFLLNQKLVPYTGNQRTDVEIFDSNGRTVKKFPNVQTTKFGVYEDSITIPESENLGKWKIQVSSEGRVITKKFSVQQSNSSLEVYLDMAKIVAHPDRKVYMNIYVKDRLSKIFSGEANIFLSARFKGSQTEEINTHVKTVKIFGNKIGVALDFQEDLELRFPTADMILRFDVDVIDAETLRTTSVSREVEMIYNTRNKIQTSRKKHFKPGFKYALKVRVKTVDGNPDNSFNKLSMSVDYHNEGRIDKQNFALNLKNGEVTTPLNPKAETTKIVVNLEFAGAKLTEVIERLPTLGGNDYMQVTVAGKNLKVGEDVKLQAQVTEEMEKLHVIIIGLNGVVHSQEYPDAIGKDVHQFTIKLTEEMKPESRGIAFYVRPSDGAIIYDEFTLNLGLSIANSLDISAVETGKPNEEVVVDIKTSEGAQVFLTATDQITPQLIPYNEISRSEIYNELTYYLNYKFPNSSLHHFEKFNGFVLQPGQPCGPGYVEDYKFESDEEDQLPEDAKYFPRTWFDVSLDATSDNVQHKDNLPKSLSTWKYYGISVHPQKGFTVAKVQPKTVVKNEIALQVKTPPKVSKDEVVWVEIGAINALKDNIQANIFVSIENGVIVKGQDELKFNLKCTKFTSINRKDLILSRISLQSEKKTDITKIPIMSNGNGDLIVNVTAGAGNYNDEVKRIIRIDKEVDPITNNGNFDIKVVIQRDGTIIMDVKVLQRQLESKDLVLDMEFPRGYKYDSHQQNNKIKSEKVNVNSMVFYLKQLGYSQTLRLEVKVTKVYTIDQHRQSAINVYDNSNTGMKDTIHYQIDVNSDNCNMIEVMEYKKKAGKAEEITNEAQRTADESSSKVDAAQKQVNDAQDKLEKALNDIQEAKRIAEEADNKAKEAFEIAAAAWTLVEEASIQEQSKSSVPVQQEISAEEQSNQVPKTAAEVHEMAKKAQNEANDAQDELADAEDEVSNAQDIAYKAKKALDSALSKLKLAQRETTEAKEQAKKIQTEAQEASSIIPDLRQNIQTVQITLETSQRAVEAALKKASQMVDNVKAARILVNNALGSVNVVKITPNIINVVEAARKSSEAAKSSVNILQNKVLNDLNNVNQSLTAATKHKEDADSLYNYCNTIKRRADNAYSSSGNAETKINNVKSGFDSSQNSYKNALNDLNDARVKRDSAKQKLTAAQAKKEKLDEEARKIEEEENMEKEATTTSPRMTFKTTTTRRTSTTTTKLARQTPTVPTTVSTEPSHVDETEQKSYKDECKMWYRFCSFGL